MQSLVDAWSLWGAGKLHDDFVLFGVRLFWWGRLGRCLEFAAALAIVLDIIGPERLRAYGEALHRRRRPTALLASYWEALRSLWPSYRSLLPFAVPRSASDLAPIDFLRLALPWVASSALPVAMIAYRFHAPLWLVEGATILAVIALVLIFLPLFALAFLALLSVVGLAIDYVGIKPLAHVLDRDRVEVVFKEVSVALLLLGFHFDLLAS